MKKVNIFEIKARLSEYLDMVEKGEQVVICRRNQPVAELRAVGPTRRVERPLGGTRLELPQTFFDPLPGDVENAFDAESRASESVSGVAQRAGGFATRTRTKRRRRS